MPVADDLQKLNHIESPFATLVLAHERLHTAKRLGKSFRAQWAMGDLSRQMQWWWMKEGTAFMAGEDWELPEAVAIVPDGLAP